MEKREILKKAILIIAILILFFMLIYPTVEATFNPDEYLPTASDTDIVKDQFSGVTDMLLTIGRLASLILLMLIGIKFMTGSVEEKAEFKQRMIPYVIGSIFVFSITNVIAIIQNVGGDIINTGSVEAMGNKIYGIVKALAASIASIILILLGVKYMSGGIEEKTEIKSSMMPYIIGAVIVFATESIASMVQEMGAGMVSSGTVEGIGQEVLSIVLTIGMAASSIILAILGIKYMMGSAEEKAQFKSSMFPYVLGAALVFQVSLLVPMIQNMAISITSSQNIESVGTEIFKIISGIGQSIATIMLTVLGIKYMMGSTEERAQYKKSLMPYIVGAVIIFATSSVLNLVQNLAAQTIGSGSINAIGEEIGGIIATIGSILSVIILVALGIKYMFSGTEERAEYKKSFFPYLIGAIVVFATTALTKIIQDVGNGVMNSANVETIGQQIITVISVIGSLSSVALLVTIGIRMMMSGSADRAEYKKSLIPYVIGATIVFAASQLAGVIYRFAINLG